MSNLGAHPESPSLSRFKSAASRNDKMENNRSPKPSSFIGTQYPNSSQPSGLTNSGMLAATGSRDLEDMDPSFDARRPVGTLHMEHPQPTFTIWNNPSSQDLPNILGDGAQVNPSLQYDMVSKPYAEPQFPIYGPDLSENSFALHNFTGRGNPLLSPQAASLPENLNSLQLARNPRALSNQGHLEPSIPPSRAPQKRKHNLDYEPEGSRGGGRGHGSQPRRQKVARKTASASRGSASLMNWWVEDDELFQLDFEEDGRQIPCRTRSVRQDIRSLVDLKWAQEKGFSWHPLPKRQRKRIKTPWGEKTPEAYCIMRLRQPVGSVMTYKKLEVLAMPLFDEEAKLVLGLNMSIKLGLHTIGEDADKKIEEEMGNSFETSTIASTCSRPSTSTFLTTDEDDFLTPSQAFWGFEPAGRF